MGAGTAAWAARAATTAALICAWRAAAASASDILQRKTKQQNRGLELEQAAAAAEKIRNEEQRTI
jgi:heme exporter protein D